MPKEEIALQLTSESLKANAIIVPATANSTERYDFVVNALINLYKDIYNKL